MSIVSCELQVRIASDCYSVALLRYCCAVRIGVICALVGDTVVGAPVVVAVAVGAFIARPVLILLASFSPVIFVLTDVPVLVAAQNAYDCSCNRVTSGLLPVSLLNVSSSALQFFACGLLPSRALCDRWDRCRGCYASFALHPSSVAFALIVAAVAHLACRSK
jgi:hypothetical protein